MIRRALWLPLALLSTTLWLSATSPAIATDHTDDTDTDAVVQDDPGGSTAADLAGEPGGVDCSHAAGAASLAPTILLGLVVVARRRRR